MTKYSKEATVTFTGSGDPYQAARHIAQSLPNGYSLVEELREGEFVIMVEVNE